MSGVADNHDLERGPDHNSQTFSYFPPEVLRRRPPAVLPVNPDPPGAYHVQRSDNLVADIGYRTRQSNGE